MRITSSCRGSSSRMTYSGDMKSPIRRLYFLVALAGTLCAPLAGAAEDRSWVERSDRISAIVFESLGPFQPEHASSLGLERFDTAALDLKPGRTARYEAAARRVLQRLAAVREGETGPRGRAYPRIQAPPRPASPASLCGDGDRRRAHRDPGARPPKRALRARRPPLAL